MNNKEYKSFYKEVGGNEGNKCHYATRLDTFGCGCGFNCDYCYAKSLLDFRGLWNPQNPSVADINKINKKIASIPPGTPAIRLGGMTDCFQPAESTYGVTYETIKALNAHHQPYLIVTKSHLVGTPKYVEILDKELAHIQITITCFDDDLYKSLAYERAPYPSQRIQAVETLYQNGFDVAVRLSPFIEEFVDYNKLANIQCNKLLVEFLRINSWITKWIGDRIDTSKYTIKQSGYRHLPLETKQKLIAKITGFDEITVCDDESEAYTYWQNSFNPNPDDCCNLRKNQ